MARVIHPSADLRKRRTRRGSRRGRASKELGAPRHMVDMSPSTAFPTTALQATTPQAAAMLPPPPRRPSGQEAGAAGPALDDLMLAVAALVGAAFSVAPQKLMEGRRRQVLTARRTWLYLLHVVCGLPVGELARALKLDRKTIVRAIQHIEDWRDDARADALLLLLEQALAKALAGRGICMQIFENKS